MWYNGNRGDVILSKYLHKSVTFNEKDESDMELHNWLRSIGHGEFNKKTKELWFKIMQESAEKDGE